MDGKIRLRFSLATIIAINIVSSAVAQPAEHQLAPAIRIAKQSMGVAQQLEDYTAVFHKREIVRGQPVAHSMTVKIRHKPFSTYLRFHKPHEGREVIYVEGKNEGNLLAHESGIKSVVGTVSLSPTSQQAMSESKHPITEMGMANMVKHVIEQWEFESKYGECEVKYYKDAKFGDRAVKVIESSHPVPRKQFPFHKTLLFIDKQTNLPIRVEQYGFPQPGQPAPRLEEFTYLDIQTNVGLNDIDFDTTNPNYNY